MKDKRNILFIALVVFLMGVGLPAVSMAADVTTECAYTDTDVVCYIYTNAGTPGLISAGVNIGYDDFELTVSTATKNEAVWYFGDGTPAGNHAYMNPETATAGEIVYIVGKLDEGAPSAGVSGARVLIGTATFTRNSTTDPGADPAAFFGISTGLGRMTGSFVNFADTSGANLDSPFNSTTTVVERGDANADGSVNILDVRTLRQNLGSSDAPVWVDCDGDGSITILDVRCLRQQI